MKADQLNASIQGIVGKGVGFKQTKLLEKSGICQKRDVCHFTGRLRYDIFIKKYKVKIIKHAQ